MCAQFGTVSTMFSHNAYADASQQAVSPVGFAGAGGITRCRSPPLRARVRPLL